MIRWGEREKEEREREKTVAHIQYKKLLVSKIFSNRKMTKKNFFFLSLTLKLFVFILYLYVI